MRSWIRTLWATAVLLFFFFGNAGGAFAQNIVYGTLDASLDTGSLEGTQFSVQYSYDADQVPPVGEAFVTLNSFDFTLLGVPFTRSDIFQGGQVIFQDGVPQNVTASFQVFLPPGSPVRNITFGFGDPLGIAYIDLNGDFGSGSFSFEPNAVPDNMAPGDFLLSGQFRQSADGRFWLVYQVDGNLVLYQGSNPLWATATYGTTPGFVSMQVDGNLVVYDSTGAALWASGTWGHPGAALLVQNDGNTVVYGTGSSPLWATNTWGR